MFQSTLASEPSSEMMWPLLTVPHEANTKHIVKKQRGTDTYFLVSSTPYALP